MSESSKGLDGYWSHFTSDNSPLPANSVSRLFVAGEQNQVWMDVWISQGIGVPAEKYGLYLTNGVSWFEYRFGERGLPIGTVGHMATDNKDRLWLSILYGGICCFDGQSSVIYEPGQSGLPTRDMTITDLYVDGLNRVWIATLGHGIYRLSDDTWERVRSDNKALNDRVKAFGIDRENHLWLVCEDVDETRFLRNGPRGWELVCAFPWDSSTKIK